MTDADRCPPPGDAARIRAAVVRQIEAAIDGSIPPATAADRVMTIVRSDGPRERTSERRRRENATWLAEMDELERQLERQGRPRCRVASIVARRVVARRLAADPLALADAEAVAQHLRRLRHRRKQNRTQRDFGAGKRLGSAHGKEISRRRHRS